MKDPAFMLASGIVVGSLTAYLSLAVVVAIAYSPPPPTTVGPTPLDWRPAESPAPGLLCAVTGYGPERIVVCWEAP